MEKELEKVSNREMFLGEFEYSVDVQCRVSLPGEWRIQAENSDWVLLPTSDTALLLMPSDAFAVFFEHLRTAGFSSGAMQLALARIGGASRQCRCDRQGRIALSRKLLDGAGIGNSLLLIGAVTHIRLSAPENWNCTEIDGRIDRSMKEIERLSNDGGALAGLIDGVLKL